MGERPGGLRFLSRAVVFVCLFVLLLHKAVTCVQASCAKGVLISGIVDGRSGKPKGVEVYVLKTDDYAGWELKVNSNGGSSWRTVHTFGSENAGESSVGDRNVVYDAHFWALPLTHCWLMKPTGYYFFTSTMSEVGSGGYNWVRLPCCCCCCCCYC